MSSAKYTAAGKMITGSDGTQLAVAWDHVDACKIVAELNRLSAKDAEIERMRGRVAECNETEEDLLLADRLLGAMHYDHALQCWRLDRISLAHLGPRESEYLKQMHARAAAGEGA